MAKFNLFQSIITQIGNNLKSQDDSNCSFEINRMNNPTTVVNILVKEGCFKIDSIERKGAIYEIKYKDLNLNAGRLKHLLRWDKSINKDKYNDLVRYDEYECKSVSKDVLTEYDGAYCKESVEHLSLTDDATFDLYAQIKGYTTKEIESYIEAGYIDRETVMCEYREFLEQCLAKDYEVGEDIEEYDFA